METLVDQILLDLFQTMIGIVFFFLGVKLRNLILKR